MSRPDFKIWEWINKSFSHFSQPKLDGASRISNTKRGDRFGKY
jgi:hypothetical protein